MLFGYWALMYFFGGSDPYSLEGNFARQVDLKILGEKHLYRGFGVPFDPEGLLSTIPAVATVLLGFMAGNLISSLGNSWKTVGWLAVTGAVLIGAGLLVGTVFPDQQTDLDQLICPLCRRYRNDGTGAAVHDR